MPLTQEIFKLSVTLEVIVSHAYKDIVSCTITITHFDFLSTTDCNRLSTCQYTVH